MGDAHGDYSRLAEAVSRLGLHEHLCVIYDTQEEQFAAALPYLRTGLERGEKCLYVVDENTAAAVLDALGKGGTDVDRYLRSGALTIAHKEETYLEQGRFEPDWMIGFLTEATAEAGAARISRVRTILAEMTWALGTSDGTAKLIEYESKLNHFFRDHDARGICQYNRTRFSPELLLGVIRTHPLVVYGGIVCKNPYYVPPDEFLKPHEASQEVERLMLNMLAWERAQRALRQSEEKHRIIVEAASDAVISVDKNGQIFLANHAATRVFEYTPSELMGMPLTILMPEFLRDSHSAGFQRYLSTGERTMNWQGMEFIGMRKTGDQFPVEISFGEFVNNGQHTFTGFIRDITERKRAEETLASQTAQAELRADVSTAFARETELGGILQRCTEAMVRHLDAAFARIWTLGKNAGVLELRASAGMYTHLDGPHGRVPVGTLEIGQIAQERKPLLTNEVVDDPLISDRAWAKREGMVALAGHPLVVEGRVVGVMAMFARRALTSGTLDTLASVADTIAQGIERKQAEAELRSLTGRILSLEDEERRRLARELHDTTSQSLAALCMNLSVLSESAGVLNPRAQEAVAESAALADQCLREIRTVSYLLHPPELDEPGLRYALSRYIDGFIQRSGIRVEIEVPPDLGRLPRLIETTVFRIVQESLTNIHRHSGSDTARVRLAKDPSNLVLEVEDAGDGIRADAPSGVGIASMRERLQQVNGRLETISRPGGTVIRATIPLPAGI
jgi:PAS domain S-box-containing protein